MPRPKTGAQRVRESEARKREQGLVKGWVWIYHEDREGLRQCAARLRTKREKAR